MNGETVEDGQNWIVCFLFPLGFFGIIPDYPVWTEKTVGLFGIIFRGSEDLFFCVVKRIVN